MELSIHLSFLLRRSLGGYTVGTTMGFHIEDVELGCGGFSPTSSLLNPAEVPTVTYE
jgi:hypothetical protein